MRTRTSSRSGGGIVSTTSARGRSFSGSMRVATCGGGVTTTGGGAGAGSGAGARGGGMASCTTMTGFGTIYCTGGGRVDSFVFAVDSKISTAAMRAPADAATSSVTRREKYRA